ncbi:MAG TPA: hypothetical protein VGM84_09045 [Steroidobacteraceae bacterium]|jgi:hypothetical protein
MVKHLVYITGRITFGNLDSGRVDPVDVLQEQVRNWLLGPAGRLASMKPSISGQYEHGMSLFALELMFFEPHGQYLSGEDSKRRAGEMFQVGFERFRNWLEANKRVRKEFGPDEGRKVRDWARNGLFHNGQIKDGLLVDIRHVEKYPFYRNPAWNGWLVDPWVLLKDLEQYFESYIDILRSATHPEHGTLKRAFEKTFRRLVVAPLM